MSALYRRVALALAVCIANAPAAAAGLLPAAQAAQAAGAERQVQAPPPTGAGERGPVPSGAGERGPVPSGAGERGPVPSGAVNSAQARKLIRDLGKDLLVLDVRTASEFGGGHIPGALNVPVASIENRMAEIPPDRPTLIVCRAGKRAAKAYETLSKARPCMAERGLWYLDATAEYREDGTYVFKAIPL